MVQNWLRWAFFVTIFCLSLHKTTSIGVQFQIKDDVEDGTTDWESIFLNLPNRTLASQYLQYYTSLPHPAGTPEDYQTATYTMNMFKQFGLNDTQITTHPVLLTYPLKRTVEMLEPSYFSLGLKEAVVDQDPSTKDPRIIPTFNAYSPSANVTGKLVYANYGSLDDFVYLNNSGIQLNGTIGIVRYGKLFRGTKAMIAQQFGLIGLLIYSDPADDGFKRGATFPDDPWGPSTHVQRGSVQFLSICPGDPRRTVCSDNPSTYNYTQSIPAIPVQPISWADALPLLSNLSTNAAPSEWQGGLNMTYNIGPGPATVRVNLQMNFTVTPIWNVISTIQGEDDTRAVIIGNHRDAWVFGASDPNSGTATLLEVARSFGVLLQKGWKPKRSIILASWDGEEYGLLGSTAWAEQNANMLQKSAVAYINVDESVSGPWFEAGATPSLESVLRAATTQIIDPNSGKPLSEVWTDPVHILGSGSDYTSFLDYLGIPSIDMGFKGDYGVYHSEYDDYYWMSHFGDPTFAYHETCAKLWGLVAMKLADSDIIPYNYTIYASRLQEYFSRIQKDIQKVNSTIDLSSLQNAISAFSDSAFKVQQEMIKPNPSDTTLNDRLVYTERSFIGSGGLPKRPYYKHVVQAPGLYKGYGADTFPGLKQTLDERDWTNFNTQYQTLWKHISAAAALLQGSNHP